MVQLFKDLERFEVCAKRASPEGPLNLNDVNDLGVCQLCKDSLLG